MEERNSRPWPMRVEVQSGFRFGSLSRLTNLTCLAADWAEEDKLAEVCFLFIYFGSEDEDQVSYPFQTPKTSCWKVRQRASSAANQLEWVCSTELASHTNESFSYFLQTEKMHFMVDSISDSIVSNVFKMTSSQNITLNL